MFIKRNWKCEISVKDSLKLEIDEKYNCGFNDNTFGHAIQKMESKVNKISLASTIFFFNDSISEIFVLILSQIIG